MFISPLEKIVNFFMPYDCMICDREGDFICKWCITEHLIPHESCCIFCKCITNDNQICIKCQKLAPIKQAYCATASTKISMELIFNLKFNRAKSIAKIIAEILADSLPYLPSDTVITHIPTSNKRARMRGYDQSQLIAKHLSEILKLEYRQFIYRYGNTQQLGANRTSRLKQIDGAFYTTQKPPLNHPILLIDDVCTTGASIISASKTLNKLKPTCIIPATFIRA